MKIVVNARLLRKNHMDGIGYFAYYALRQITRQNPDIEFHFLFDSGIDEEFLFAPNIIAHNLFPPAKHAVLNVIWFEWSVKRYLQKVKPDLFLSPEGTLCLGWDGKQYGVMHDINFVHYPRDLKWTNRIYYNYFFPKYAHKATRLGTISAYSKNDIVKSFGIDEQKIDIIYLGSNEFYSPVDDTVKNETKQQYSKGRDYFIFVGTLSPRKNILRLMQAFELFKQATGSDMQLLISGKEMYRTNELHEYRQQMRHGNDVIFTGRLSDDELKKVFGSAFALVFVPYFEGFGIPPVEAMQCDVPVISSNVTSMPEVVGDAGLLVDPFDINAIAAAMERLFREPALRQELIAKGRKRKELFSWEKAANVWWDCVSKLL